MPTSPNTLHTTCSARCPGPPGWGRCAGQLRSHYAAVTNDPQVSGVCHKGSLLFMLSIQCGHLRLWSAVSLPWTPADISPDLEHCWAPGRDKRETTEPCHKSHATFCNITMAKVSHMLTSAIYGTRNIILSQVGCRRGAVDILMRIWSTAKAYQEVVGNQSSLGRWGMGEGHACR